MVASSKYIRVLEEDAEYITIEVRWMTVPEVELFVVGEQRLCGLRSGCGPAEINFENMLPSFARSLGIADVMASVRRIHQRQVRCIYVGVTRSPSWRWRLCRGYTPEPDSEPTQPQCDRFDVMYPVVVEHGGAIEALENHMYSFLWSEFPGEVVNSRTYHAGSIVDNATYFLYFCVTWA